MNDHESILDDLKDINEMMSGGSVDMANLMELIGKIRTKTKKIRKYCDEVDELLDAVMDTVREMG